MPLLAGRVYPVVAPAHHALQPQAEDLLDMDVGLGRRVEEVLPELSDCFFARVYGAVRGRAGIFEDSIIAHQYHHGCHVMTV